MHWSEIGNLECSGMLQKIGVISVEFWSCFFIAFLPPHYSSLQNLRSGIASYKRRKLFLSSDKNKSVGLTLYQKEFLK